MPTRRREKAPRRTGGLSGLTERGPAWIQAIVASLALVFTVLVAYGLVGRNAGSDGSTPTPTPPGVAASVAPPNAPRVVLKAVREAPEVSAVGEFENLDLSLDAIYLLGIPAEGSGDEAVVVRGQPTTVATIGPGLASGGWEAHRPAPATGLAWQALIYPVALGASGGLEDLKEHGAAAEGVKAASEIIQPEQ